MQFYAHLSVSLAACGLGDFDAARNHIRTGLRIMSMDLQLAGTLTICLPTLALILAHEGRRVRAAEVLSLAFSHPVGPVGWMEQWPLLTRLRADLEAELGPARCAQAWAHGERPRPESDSGRPPGRDRDRATDRQPSASHTAQRARAGGAGVAC
ncbi:MAG: hypothetical protein M5R40_24235 [Anaerolineae bacterium]|nr:hypothetical protein [Anaerolineae bacterium]